MEPDFSLQSLAQSSAIPHWRRAVLAAPASANLVTRRASQPPLFPPVCPFCEQPANDNINVERKFLLDGSDDDESAPAPVVESVNVPFCAACVALHRHAQQSPHPLLPLKRLFSRGEGLGGAIVLVIGCLFIISGIEKLSWIPIAFGCLPLFIGLWLMRSVWTQTAHLAVPPPTNVDLAIDFTPDLSLPYEPAWRAFQFRSATYAALFAAANEHELWQTDGPEAQAAASKRRRDKGKNAWILWVFGAAVALYWLWDEVIHPYFWAYIHDYFTR